MAWPEVIPYIRYQDPKAMIEWLERAFGFKKHAVLCWGKIWTPQPQATRWAMTILPTLPENTSGFSVCRRCGMWDGCGKPPEQVSASRDTIKHFVQPLFAFGHGLRAITNSSSVDRHAIRR